MSVTWKADSTHSEIQFKVKHLMITNVTGYFKNYDITVETEDENFKSVKKVEFSADINSIDTNNDQRDTHLKSGDFFDAEKYPRLTFTAEAFEIAGDSATLQGQLTIRDITKPVKLNVELGGVVVDPYGQRKAGFIVTGKIDRKEFNLTWNAVTEAGQVVVSNDIKIHCEVQLVKQQREQASAA